MKTIAEKIEEGLDRFYKALQRKRVLKSLEEVFATTNEEDLVSAMTVAALNDKLAGFEPVLNDMGKITGYKTNIGGADTVFPFIDMKDIIVMRFSLGGGRGAWSTAHDIRGYIPAGYKKITVEGLKNGATMSIGGVQVTNGVSYLEEPMIKDTEYDSYEYIFSTVYKSQSTSESNPGIVTLYASI